jgi:hypothetical protein
VSTGGGGQGARGAAWWWDEFPTGGYVGLRRLDMLVYDDSDGEDEDDEGHDETWRPTNRTPAPATTPMPMTVAICENNELVP